ncbi:type III secretion system export apparatus subunit SctR [Noviherbaspirillum sp. CPCC 100848]|uniref:Type III secretion system export apparatus subunit SctR n=1 Tax=Noviherbaspirillum album TaxID=3080276 RepID=A0ABU6JAQ7_9BURK|nr:type III secretion system export apparatus subunit SctR [Noviherbaspirillum sp. CPCC 100848]MEC4720721.1 type III secretion system export apparatus subunit SctR [Noviherbaspirillum sp. CPCC 100848]
MNQFDPISLGVVLALMALVPLLVMVTTSFLKIAVVMSLLRNALGIQQIPPNLALYALALILSVYIMAPVGMRMYQTVLVAPAASNQSVAGLVSNLQTGVEPLRKFMDRNSRPEQKEFFYKTARKLWGAEMAADLKREDMIVLMPAFMTSELMAAFQIGFLIYLPFIIIDLIVSNILLAMGMMMVSPVTISLPLKLFLFVMVNGWSQLIQGLVYSYT